MAEAVKLKEEHESGGGPSLSVPGPLRRIGEYPRRWKLFLHDVRTEMAKVVWPSKQEVISMTGVVIVTVAFFGLFFLLTDTTFSYLETLVLNYFKH